MVISLSQLVYAWPGQPPLLRIDALTLEAGQSLFVGGPSGSGKTHLARGLAEVRTAAVDGATWTSDVRCSPIGAGPTPDPSAVRRLPMPLSALGFARAARLWAAT